jgi:hypothetical protein
MIGSMKPFLLLVVLLQASVTANYKVSGRVTAFPNVARAPSTLLLRSFALNQGPGQGVTTKINADGSFEFTGLPGGEYDLNFYDANQPFQQVGQTSAGEYIPRFSPVGPGLNFTSTGDVADLEIKLPADVVGQVVLSDGAEPPANAVLVVSSTPLLANGAFRSARLMRSQAVAEHDGRFVLPLFPGQNSLSVNAPAGYSVKSIKYGALDVTTGALNLTGLPTSTLLITLDRIPVVQFDPDIRARRPIR